MRTSVSESGKPQSTRLGSTIIGGSAWSDLSSKRMALTFPEPRAAEVDTRRTLLQIVDMQDHFVGPKSRKIMWQADTHISNIRALLEKARELDMTVVYQYSTTIRNPYEKTPKTFRADPSFGPMIDEIKPIDRPNEYIVSKTTHDIFFHTHMDDLLKKLVEIDTVIVVGTVTNVCVLYAVSGYCVRGYKVLVPMDAVICRSPEDQAMTVRVMAIHSGNFRPTITLSNMITFRK